MGLIRPSYPQGSGSSADQQEAYGLIPPLSDTPVTPFPGFGGPASNSAIGDSATTGTATTASHSDHVHGREALSTATPLVESGSGSAGVGTKNSREDHVHPAAVVSSNELDYAEFTNDNSITATSEGTANSVVSGHSVTYDGATTIIIEFFCPRAQAASGASHFLQIVLLEDGTSIGSIGLVGAVSASGNNYTFGTARRRRTPSAGAHTYSVAAFVDASTGHVVGGAGGSGNFVPGYIRITK